MAVLNNRLTKSLKIWWQTLTGWLKPSPARQWDEVINSVPSSPWWQHLESAHTPLPVQPVGVGSTKWQSQWQTPPSSPPAHSFHLPESYWKARAVLRWSFPSSVASPRPSTEFSFYKHWHHVYCDTWNRTKVASIRCWMLGIKFRACLVRTRPTSGIGFYILQHPWNTDLGVGTLQRWLK